MFTVVTNPIIKNEKHVDDEFLFTQDGKTTRKTGVNSAKFVIDNGGLANFELDTSNNVLARLVNRVNKALGNPAVKVQKEIVSKPEPAVEEAEVKVTSDNKPLQEVKGMGSVEAVSQSRVFTTDEGDTITVIA